MQSEYTNISLLSIIVKNIIQITMQEKKYMYCIKNIEKLGWI